MTQKEFLEKITELNEKVEQNLLDWKNEAVELTTNYAANIQALREEKEEYEKKREELEKKFWYVHRKAISRALLVSVFLVGLAWFVNNTEGVCSEIGYLGVSVEVNCKN